MSDFQKGDRVLYIPTHAYGDPNHNDCEAGVVSSVRGDTVFVDAEIRTVQDAAAYYRKHAHSIVPSDVGVLRGKDLACWCPLDKPCHADVLLELANRPPSTER